METRGSDGNSIKSCEAFDFWHLSQTKCQHSDMKGRIPYLSEELLAIDSFWERESWFSLRDSLLARWIHASVQNDKESKKKNEQHKLDLIEEQKRKIKMVG